MLSFIFAVERKERAELSSVMESGIAFTFQGRKIWIMLLFFYPYKILIKNFVHVYRQAIKKEKFCCSPFLFSHLQSTQECLKCLPHISCKKEVFLSSLQGEKKTKKLVFRISYVKSYCGKRNLFDLATALLP